MSGEISGVLSREKIIEEKGEKRGSLGSENRCLPPANWGAIWKSEPEKPVFVFLNGNETEEFCDGAFDVTLKHT